MNEPCQDSLSDVQRLVRDPIGIDGPAAGIHISNLFALIKFRPRVNETTDQPHHTGGDRKPLDMPQNLPLFNQLPDGRDRYETARHRGSDHLTRSTL